MNGRFPPTARRLAEARLAGDVAASPALVRAALLVAGIGALAAIAGALGARLVGLARAAFAAAGALTMVADGAALPASVSDTMDGGWLGLLAALAPVLVTAMVAALLVGIGQTGAVVALPRRRGPRAGALVGAGLALVVAATVAASAIAEWPTVVAAGSGTALLAVGAHALGRIALSAAVALAVAGVADLLLRRVAWRRSLWMSRGEVEAERRESEGDPRHRAERRRQHRALALPDANAVDGAAVVLASDGAAAALAVRGDALVVVAAGTGLAASAVVERARRAGRPVRHDARLAAALAVLDAGTPVPPALVDAAAAWLGRDAR